METLFVGHSFPVAAVPSAQVHWLTSHESPTSVWPLLQEIHLASSIAGQFAPEAAVPPVHEHAFSWQM